MEKANVYFTDFHTHSGTSLAQKLDQLIRMAKIGTIDMDGKFVAIKMTFGELGNMAYLRPQYAKAVVDLVKGKGGRPFLTDCNTLYPGSRKHALEHLDCAALNGFNPTTTGCQILIADGLKGTDDVTVPVRNGEYCKEAYIGRAIMDADIVISLTHFKGHGTAGYGGAIKNLGMGGGSRAGKMQQHDGGQPRVKQDLCRGCRHCIKECGSFAIDYQADGKAIIDTEKCTGCGRCIGACSYDAIANQAWDAGGLLGCKMSEYAQAICDGRPTFHIALIRDVSPNCDCEDHNDVPILPDLGMLASFDPVALDQACIDLCQAAEPVKGSILDRHLQDPNRQHFHEHFRDTHPNVHWEETLEHAEKIGLGTRSYELIKMEPAGH